MVYFFKSSAARCELLTSIIDIAVLSVYGHRLTLVISPPQLVD
jgi:hypothetical protein